MGDTYKPTGARVVWGSRFADVCSTTPDAIAHDGAAAETTNVVYIDHRDIFCYVELRITGRSERTHTGGVFGVNGRMRFTGADDSGEWIDVVIVNAATVARAA